jgi:hypothetical protein
MTRAVLAVFVAAAFIPAAPAARQLQTDDVVQRARAYAEQWETQLSGLVASEEYTQHLDGRFGGSQTLRLRADVLLVRVHEAWVGFRDIAEVDGRPISGRSNRLQDLFVTHPMSEAMEQARRISDEGSRYNLGTVYRNFNVPTTALRLLEPDRAGRISFKLEGPGHVEGLPASVVLSYKERGAPTILETLSRQPITTSGQFWIEPESGRVLATEMRWRLAPPRDVADLAAKVRVVYRSNAATGVWVPADMTEAYETQNEVIDCHAVYTNVRRFTVKVDDSVTLPQ